MGRHVIGVHIGIATLTFVPACAEMRFSRVEDDSSTGQSVQFMMMEPCYDEYDFEGANYWDPLKGPKGPWEATTPSQDLPPSDRGAVSPPFTHAYTERWGLAVVEDYPWAKKPFEGSAPNSQGMTGALSLLFIYGDDVDDQKFEHYRLSDPTLEYRKLERRRPIPFYTKKDGIIFVREDDESWLYSYGPPKNKELDLRFAAVEFDHTGLRAVSLKYGDLGGNVYLKVGSQPPHEVADFSDLHQTQHPGYRIWASAVHDGSTVRGTLFLVGDLSSFAIGGENLRIDDICLFYEDCFPSDQATVICSPGVPWVSAASSTPAQGWSDFRGLKFRVEDGPTPTGLEPRRVKTVSINNLHPSTTQDVIITARLLDENGSLLDEGNEVLPMGAPMPRTVNIALAGGVDLSAGETYQVALFHDAPGALSVEPFTKTSDTEWHDPSLLLEVTDVVEAPDPSAPLSSDASLQRLILPIQIVLGCQPLP